MPKLSKNYRYRQRPGKISKISEYSEEVSYGEYESHFSPKKASPYKYLTDNDRRRYHSVNNSTWKEDYLSSKDKFPQNYTYLKTSKEKLSELLAENQK